MAKFEPFSILPLDYFTSQNPFSGSRGGFNYKIVPKGEEVLVFTWYGRNCSAKSQIEAETTFPLVEESRPLVCQWLDEQYLVYDKWRLEQYFKGVD